MSWEDREVVMTFFIRSMTVNLGVLRMQPPVVMFSSDQGRAGAKE